MQYLFRKETHLREKCRSQDMTRVPPYRTETSFTVTGFDNVTHTNTTMSHLSVNFSEFDSSVDVFPGGLYHWVPSYVTQQSDTVPVLVHS